MAHNDDKPIRTLAEIQKAAQKKPPKNEEEYAKISDDGKSLFIRIPAKIKKDFNVQKGQYMKFYAEIKNDKLGELHISIQNGKPDKHR